MIHPSADVSPTATVGSGTQIWARSHIREGAILGSHCIVGENVYIDADVRVGNNVKIQNGALLYRYLILGDGVFVGPQVCFTNDPHPRAVTPQGRLMNLSDWQPGKTEVGTGASVGAGTIVLSGLRIGSWAMIGAGSVVTRGVQDHALVLGSPARHVGWVCPCGCRLTDHGAGESGRLWRCPKDGWEHREIP